MNSPFKFLDSYSKADKDFYFGREAETEALYSKVFAGKMLLVYGVSGTGKSSLLHCGLANKFNDADWLPVSVRRGQNINESLANEIAKLALTPTKGSLRKQINSLYLDHFKPIFLLFDQFEELFIFGNDNEKSIFVKQLNELIVSDVQCRCIFVIREEYLALLTEFETEIPQLLQNRMRIERLTKAQAKVCIEGPCQVAGISLETGFAENLLLRLAGNKSDVELTYLQVFLDKIYRQNQQHFSLKILEESGNVSDLLGEFLETQINSGPNPDVALTVLKTFVSSQGTKRQISIADIEIAAKNLGKIIPSQQITEIVTRLVDLRILRDKDENDRYELRHDALAAKIYEKITLVEKELIQVQQFIDNALQIFQKTGNRLDKKDLAYVEVYESVLFLPDEAAHFVKECKQIINRDKQLKSRIRLVSLLIACLFLAVNFAKFYKEYDHKRVNLLISLALLNIQDDYYDAADNWLEAFEYDSTSLQVTRTGIELLFNMPENENFTLGERLPESPDGKWKGIKKDTLLYIFNEKNLLAVQLPIEKDMRFTLLNDSLLIFHNETKLIWKNLRNEVVQEMKTGNGQKYQIKPLADNFYIFIEDGMPAVVNPTTRYIKYFEKVTRFDLWSLKPFSNLLYLNDKLLKIENGQLFEDKLEPPYLQHPTLILKNQYLAGFDTQFLYLLELKSKKEIKIPLSIKKIIDENEYAILQDTAFFLYTINENFELKKHVKFEDDIYKSGYSLQNVFHSNSLNKSIAFNQKINSIDFINCPTNLKREIDFESKKHDTLYDILQVIYPNQNFSALKINYDQYVKIIKGVFPKLESNNISNISFRQFVKGFDMTTKSNPFSAFTEVSTSGNVLTVTNPGYISFYNKHMQLEFGLFNQYPDTGLLVENQTDISFDDRYVLQAENGKIQLYRYGNEHPIKTISVSRDFTNRVAWSKKELTFAIAHHRDSISYYILEESHDKKQVELIKLQALRLADNKEYYDKNIKERENRITDIDFHPIQNKALLIGTQQGYVFTLQDKIANQLWALKQKIGIISKVEWAQNPNFIILSLLHKQEETENEIVIIAQQKIYYSPEKGYEIYLIQEKQDYRFTRFDFHPHLPMYFDENKLMSLHPSNFEIKIKAQYLDKKLNSTTRLFFDQADGYIKNYGEYHIQVPYTPAAMQKAIKNRKNYWGDMLPFRLGSRNTKPIEYY